MALSAARASLRDEAPDGGPVACWMLCASVCCTQLAIVVSANRRSFIKEHFGADTNTSRTPKRRWAHSRPRIGVRSCIRPVSLDRALEHVEEAARHCTHAKNLPGESIGFPRSSTGSERVAGFGYRSLWWRVRGVQRPGVFEESLVPPAPDPRGTVPPPVTGVPARTRRASPYVPI